MYKRFNLTAVFILSFVFVTNFSFSVVFVANGFAGAEADNNPIYFDANSKDSICGYSSGSDIIFSAKDPQEGTIDISLSFNKKQVDVQIGYGESEGEISIYGSDFNTGGITSITQ